MDNSIGEKGICKSSKEETCWTLSEFPIATVINYHKLYDLKQYKFILLQC